MHIISFERLSADREVEAMLKEYMSKLPFLQSSQNKARRKEQLAEKNEPPMEEMEAKREEETLWPEGVPFESGAQEAETPEADQPAEPEQPEQPDLFAAGRDAYRAGDYESALAAFRQAAEQGHAEAQFLCGQMYRRGIAAESDDKTALLWYKRAAKQGHMGGQLACALCFEEGRGAEMDLKRALYWYELAAKQGSVDAQLKCGCMYYGGRAETRNPKKARRWLEAAAENGNQEARKLLEERF